MRKNIKSFIVCMVLCSVSVLMFSGCGEQKSGQTIDEPEITAEYLAGEYAEQLLTDGAEKILGTVTIQDKGENSYNVLVSERQIIPNSDYDEGFYIADNNITKEVALGYEARIACLHDGKLSVETPEEFMKMQSSDHEQLYNVYIMGDSAELIIAADPEDIDAE